MAKEKTTTASRRGEGTVGVVRGAMQIGFGHRSKDLSFTASSGLERFSHSPPDSLPLSRRHLFAHSAAFMLSQPGARLLRGFLAECEHCSYMSVLNRDVNTNGFWQGPGPQWTHCRSRKRNKRERGTGGRGRAQG